MFYSGQTLCILQCIQYYVYLEAYVENIVL